MRTITVAVLTLAVVQSAAAQALPSEPIDIGTTPQFVFDNYIIDNYWPIKYKREAVTRVFHQPKKYTGNPVIAGDGGYVTVVRDEKTGKFRLWYQTWVASAVKARPRKMLFLSSMSDTITILIC